MIGCRAHMRRKFDEALYALPPDKRENSSALIGLEYRNIVYINLFFCSTFIFQTRPNPCLDPLKKGDGWDHCLIHRLHYFILREFALVLCFLLALYPGFSTCDIAAEKGHVHAAEISRRVVVCPHPLKSGPVANRKQRGPALIRPGGLG